MNTNPELTAAKANLVKAAGEVDLLEPLRQHPRLTMAIAGASGVLMGSSEVKLGHVASIIRSLTGLFGTAMAAAERHAAPQTKPPSDS